MPVAPAWVRLTRGEQRRVDLQCGVQPITIRVLGPSPELLSRLAVLLRPAADPPRLRGQQLVLGLDAKGRAACYLPDGAMRGTLAVKKPTNAGRGVWPRYAATFPLQDEHGAFDLQQTEGELVLSPIESLVGIAVGSPGHEQHAWLSLEAMRRTHEVEPLFLCRRASAESAETMHGSTEQLGPFTMLRSNGRTSGDLWFVPPAAPNRLGTLVVHVADAPEPGSVVDLLAECIDGARDQARQPTKLDRATGRSSLLPGTYRLLWEVNLGRGPVAAEAVVITAGGVTELTLSPPALQRWTLQLRNVDTSRAEALFLKLGTAYSLGAARKGDFLMDRFEPPRVGETGEVFAWVLKCSFPASVVNVDAAALRAEVTSTVTDAVWCHLRAQAMAGGRLGIRLQRTAGLDTTLPAFLDGDIHVPLMPGTTRNGCVIETLEGRTQLVAWFQLSPELPDQVARGSGRWTTLRIERPILRAEVLAAGPPGVAARSVKTTEKPGKSPLFVANATRPFHVDSNQVAARRSTPRCRSSCADARGLPGRLLRSRIHQFDHRAPKRVADAQITLAVAKPMMPVARIGRIFGIAKELPRRHEPRAGRNLLVLTTALLRAAKNFIVHVPGLADHERQLRISKLRAQVLCQQHEILFVLGSGFVIATVIPALKPQHAFEPRRMPGKGRKLLGDGHHRGAVLSNHLRVVRPGVPRRTRRPKVHRQALATPRRLDEQHRLRKVIAERPPDAEFRPKMVFVIVDRITN